MNRKGYVEETYFTFSYSPVPDDAGDVGGVLVTVQETTEQVLSERRLRVLQELAVQTAATRTTEQACQRAAEALQQNLADLPFFRLYLVDEQGQRARLTASSEPQAGAAGSAGEVELSEAGTADAQALATAVRSPGTNASGHGIGLATVHRILKASEGSVLVESALGVGTTFRLRLPLAPRPPAQGEAASA
jgi:light-regulated signal transduction histidine kinase (bacteriophytochrome)